MLYPGCNQFNRNCSHSLPCCSCYFMVKLKLQHVYFGQLNDDDDKRHWPLKLNTIFHISCIFIHILAVCSEK